MATAAGDILAPSLRGPLMSPLLTHPATVAVVYPAVLLLAVAVWLYLTSQVPDWKVKHRLGSGVPTKVIFERLDWERSLEAAEAKALADLAAAWDLVDRRPVVVVA